MGDILAFVAPNFEGKVQKTVGKTLLHRLLKKLRGQLWTTPFFWVGELRKNVRKQWWCTFPGSGCKNCTILLGKICTFCTKSGTETQIFKGADRKNLGICTKFFVLRTGFLRDEEHLGNLPLKTPEKDGNPCAGVR